MSITSGVKNRRIVSDTAAGVPTLPRQIASESDIIILDAAC
jgi:hypothetical protein